MQREGFVVIVFLPQTAVGSNRRTLESCVSFSKASDLDARVMFVYKCQHLRIGTA